MPTNQEIIGEVVGRRTSNAKHFKLMDGSYKAEIYGSDVHFQDKTGNWHNINTDLFDEADLDTYAGPIEKYGSGLMEKVRELVSIAKKSGALNRENFDFQGLQVPFEAKLPRNFRNGYSVGDGANRLVFTPVGASPSRGFVDASQTNCIMYNDPWNDTDVHLELTVQGIKETIILKTTMSPTLFSFEVTGPLADDLTAGQMKLQPAWLQDAKGIKRDVKQSVRRAGGKVFVDLTTDVTGLAYPVEIDPTVTIQPTTSAAAKDTYVISDFPNNTTSDNGTDLGIGWNGTQNGSRAERSLIQFDLSSIPANAVLSSATIDLYYYTEYGGSAATTINWYANLAAWGENTVTWATKPSTEAASGGAVTVPVPTHQWVSFPVTDSTQRMVNGSLANNGWTGIGTVESGSTIAFVEFYSADYSPNGTAYMPKFTVNYTQPPTAPVVTYPNGGETIDTTATITWTAATDPDTAQASLQYQIQLSTDNAATYADIVALTAAGATSYATDFSAKTETSTALVRIRAYDGANYGPWDPSNAVFTIRHNVAPTAPTNLAPTGGAPLDRALLQRLSWKHNDTDGLAQSKFDLQWRLQATPAGAWNTVTQTTPNQYWDAPANTFPHGTIEWQVRTYDQGNLVGPYSAQQTFLAGDKPATGTITDPANNGTVAIARPTVQWSSAGQTNYQLQIKQGATITWDSGDVASTNKAVTVPVDLANNTTYTANLRVKNADGLWSDYVTNTFTVSFTAPATPTTTVTPNGSNIRIAITNPVPSGTQPAVTGNDVYRRKVGSASWDRIKIGVANNGTYDDYAVTSGVSYEYYVRAQGSNTTYSDSATASASITLSGVWLHDVADPAGTAYRFQYDGQGRTSDWQAEATFMQFAGRNKPVVEFGEIEDGKYSVQLLMKNADLDYQKLDSLVKRKGTVCWRDGRGRKAFGVITHLPVQDEFYGYKTTVALTEIAYSEVV